MTMEGNSGLYSGAANLLTVCLCVPRCSRHAPDCPIIAVRGPVSEASGWDGTDLWPLQKGAEAASDGKDRPSVGGLGVRQTFVYRTPEDLTTHSTCAILRL
jgi:hypothetical protein